MVIYISKSVECNTLNPLFEKKQDLDSIFCGHNSNSWSSEFDYKKIRIISNRCRDHRTKIYIAVLKGFSHTSLELRPIERKYRNPYYGIKNQTLSFFLEDCPCHVIEPYLL
jgi:hypothetical protein